MNDPDQHDGNSHHQHRSAGASHRLCRCAHVVTAVVAMLGAGDFFGEASLTGQPIRIESETAITPSSVLVIEKKQMLKVLHKQHAMSDRFISHILSRNIRIEQDLIDQLFNSSEKRLARALTATTPVSTSCSTSTCAIVTRIGLS